MMQANIIIHPTRCKGSARLYDVSGRVMMSVKHHLKRHGLIAGNEPPRLGEGLAGSHVSYCNDVDLWPARPYPLEQSATLP